MASAIHPRAQKILDYWLGEGWESAPDTDTRPQKKATWFQGGAEVDRMIFDTFNDDCEALLRGDYDSWSDSNEVHETLAGIILGDQFFRNAFRETPKMYAGDMTSLRWAKDLVARGDIKKLKPIQRSWVHLPFMHSESLEDQDECVRLYGDMLAEVQQLQGGEDIVNMTAWGLKFAESHRKMISEWGRFPHRNAILGRESTPEEIKGLAEGQIEKW